MLTFWRSMKAKFYASLSFSQFAPSHLGRASCCFLTSRYHDSELRTLTYTCRQLSKAIPSRFQKTSWIQWIQIDVFGCSPKILYHWIWRGFGQSCQKSVSGIVCQVLFIFYHSWNLLLDRIRIAFGSSSLGIDRYCSGIKSHWWGSELFFWRENSWNFA